MVVCAGRLAALAIFRIRSSSQKKFCDFPGRRRVLLSGES